MVFDVNQPDDQGAALLDRFKFQWAGCEEWALSIAPGVDPLLMFCVIMRSSKLDALFHVLLNLIHHLLGLIDGVVNLCEILH